MTRTLRFAPAAALAALVVAPAAAADRAAGDSAGRELAATCAPCHGTDGRARGAMRPLAGMPAPALVTLFEGFRANARDGATVMHQIAPGYTDAQIRLIADHFAAQERAK